MDTLKGIFARVSLETIAVDVDERLYSLDALFRTCYKFTDIAYLYLRREAEGKVRAYIVPKDKNSDLPTLAGQFCNELLDHQVRTLVSAESGKIRELIIAQAFSEGNLLEEASDREGDYGSDRLGIGDFHEPDK